MLLLGRISRHPLYGVQLFQVRFVQREPVHNFPKKVILGINFKEVQIYNEYMVILGKMEMEQISDLSFSLNRVRVWVGKEESIEFRSKQMFDLYRLLEEYKKI